MIKSRYLIVGLVTAWMTALLLASDAQAVVVVPTQDKWIRESDPNGTYENDALWSCNTGGCGENRWTVAEFDLSGVTEPITSAWMEFAPRTRADGNAQQVAFQIPDGIAGSFSWNDYQSTKAGSEVALGGLGSITAPAAGLPFNTYTQGDDATAADVALLEGLRTSTNLLTMSFRPTTDNEAFEWNDGANAGGGGFEADLPFRLVINEAPAVIDPNENTVNASAEVWIREAATAEGITYENDLISVWSAAFGDGGARRYGVVEFDVSEFAGQSLAGVDLRLWAGANGFSDDIQPIKQSAVVIDTSGGTQTTSMTWDAYQGEYAGVAQALSGLGTLDFAPVDSGDLSVFVDSSASGADLALIEAAANSANGLLTLVLIADEDGSEYGKSWGDGPDGFAGLDAQLVVTVVPEPSSILLIVTGLVGLAGIGRRRRR